MAVDWLCILSARSASATFHNGFYFPSKQMNETVLPMSSRLPRPSAAFPLQSAGHPSPPCRGRSNPAAVSQAAVTMSSERALAIQNRDWFSHPALGARQRSVPPAFSCQHSNLGHSACGGCGMWPACQTSWLGRHCSKSGSWFLCLLAVTCQAAYCMWMKWSWRVIWFSIWLIQNCVFLGFGFVF